MDNVNKEEKPEYKKPINIEGIGKITSVGELNMERWVKILLKSKYVTGNG